MVKWDERDLIFSEQISPTLFYYASNYITVCFPYEALFLYAIFVFYSSIYCCSQDCLVILEQCDTFISVSKIRNQLLFLKPIFLVNKMSIKFADESSHFAEFISSSPNHALIFFCDNNLIQTCEADLHAYFFYVILL